MAFNKFQDFLSGLVARQRDRFSKNGAPDIEELLDSLMGNSGEVSAIVAARELLDVYKGLDDEGKKEFFFNIEQNFNTEPASVKLAFGTFDADPSSTNLNRLYRAAEPRRVELLRRLNQTPGATHDLVGMRKDLLGLLREHPQLSAVDENFTHLFRSWFSRGFLLLQTIDWSTSAAILNRIIRYEAVHAIKDWDDLRSRVDRPNRRCFAFFHPALTDEPLIFVEVALSTEIPGSIDSILNDTADEDVDPSKFTTATFYSISNCQPGLKNISFGNFLIKQVVQELKADFPSIKQFVTLSPIPGFKRWLDTDADADSVELLELKTEMRSLDIVADNVAEHEEAIRKLMLNYLLLAKKGKYPLDPVARFHLGNGAQVHQIHGAADLSDKGLAQSYGAMVNYLYDLRYIERNHEQYVTEGKIEFNDKLKAALLKG
ncbi:MAG: malonyl-CoA decarboxylase [Proteobacteria bacterium]|nr:malonyl-CoA decarboxylase [Pseudomonadota bacterium]